MNRRLCLVFVCEAMIVVTWAVGCGNHQALTAPGAVPTAAFLAGQVVEPGSLGLPGVHISVIGGPKDGQVVLTDQYGYFYVSGAAGAQQVQATKDGYLTTTVAVAAHPEQINIVMQPTTPYADLNGSWHMTFSASPSCTLPSDVSTRRYTAAIQQDTARLTIRLSDAQFVTGRYGNTENWMFGRVFGAYVSLSMNTDDSCLYYGTCFLEQIADGRTFSMNGSATGSLNGGVLSAVFAGAVTVSGASGTPGATCTAADHRLTFTR